MLLALIARFACVISALEHKYESGLLAVRRAVSFGELSAFLLPVFGCVMSGYSAQATVWQPIKVGFLEKRADQMKKCRQKEGESFFIANIHKIEKIQQFVFLSYSREGG